MVSTFGIYFVASFLYVSILLFYRRDKAAELSYSVILGTCSPVSCNTCASRPVSQTCSTSTHFVIYTMYVSPLVCSFCVRLTALCSQVSWGTKGSDKAEALPSVSSSKSKDADVPVVEDTTRVQEDVDAAFKETVTRAITKIENKEVPEKPTMDDQNKTFRTRLVAAWILSNAALAIAIENLNGLPNSKDPSQDEARLMQKQNTYFGIILYSTFGLAAVRFAGVCIPRRLYHRWLTHHSHSACSTSSSGICSGSAAGISCSALSPCFRFGPNIHRDITDTVAVRLALHHIYTSWTLPIITPVSSLTITVVADELLNMHIPLLFDH